MTITAVLAYLLIICYFVVERLLRKGEKALSLQTDAFYIGNLAVTANYRNQGIGRQLLSQCIAEAKTTSSTIAAYLGR